MTIDNQLSFKSHMNNLESKIARFVGVISKLSYFFPHNTLLTLYYSLVHYHFLYALSDWASSHNPYLTKLQSKAFRVFSETRIRDSMSQHFNFNTYFSYTTNTSSYLTCQTSNNNIFYPVSEICDVNAY